MKFGPFTLDVISDGRIWLDGGAMFGVVPKTLWSKSIESDELNRIPLETNCLLVRGSGGTVLIETGLGNQYSEKQYKIYNFEFGKRLLEGLSSLGVKPEDVDVVIQTHLHFDHCGTLAQQSKSGRYSATFPNADVVVQKGEWEAAHKPDYRSRPSYFPPEFYDSVMNNGNLRLVEGEAKIAPGISVKLMGGHTLHHQIVEISEGDDKVVYAGDFIPMTRHVNLAYSMSYDINPITTVEDKLTFLPQAEEGNWLVVFEHDPDTPFARIKKDGSKWMTVPYSGD